LSEFADRHVLVTGASSGIGLATALLLARQGARVYLIARSELKLAAAAAAIAREGGKSAFSAADVADRGALLAAIDKAERAFGPVAGLFANAGSAGRFAPLSEYDDVLFETVLRINLTSIYWAIKRLLPGMLERRHGSIVVTGSLASERGMPHNVAYVASKHGVLGLARAAAAEAAPHNVRVNCVVPGLIETPMLLQLDPAASPQALRARLGANVPLGRIGTAEELAQLVCFLLSDRASHITAQSIAVDGGVLGTLIPQ
jgi:NAD(P)-dependent dehydrogenase (short-subunit alcohol dehydrogenase family)